MSPRFGAVVATLGCVLFLACGTVDVGQNFQFAEVVYDQNYFYCKVEPMLMQEQCGPGATGTDPPNGCHYNVTPFRLQQHDPVPCTGVVPKSTAVPTEAQNNYQAAEREMSPDPDRAALLNRPTQRAAHPRQIFPLSGPQADLIRSWATQFSSQ
ncbi:MAG TPA: hypothetical protein VH142_05060 [Polyangiaceae bacterium]|nr:hypothetical protein [Polyangiaceae bacterium]